jgi:hypothetical protein
MHLDRAAGLAVEAGEDAEQRRLAAAARPNDANELTRRNVKIDIVERNDGALRADILAAEPHDLDRGAAALCAHV